MENTYGIGITNRYDLFYIDDEAGDPFEALATKKQKGQKKGLVLNAVAPPTAAPTVNSQQEPKTKSKNSEKENKATPNNDANNKSGKDKTQGKELSTQTRNERRGIKETQKDNIRSQQQRDGDNKSVKPINNENREERNNRRNKEVTADDKNFQRRTGQNSGRRFDGRGKREFDRQSGNEKTGVKAIDKKDGAGAHNWGSVKQDAEEYSKMQDLNGDLSGDDKPKEQTEPKATEETTKEATEVKTPAEEEVKEMTLDEWKAQKAAVRSKPQYNLRKAGEGEDSTVWQEMVALDKKKGENESDEQEYDENGTAQQKQKQKQVLDIEFHFNDSRRAAGRTRGRGGKNNRNLGPRPEKRDVEKKEGERGIPLEGPPIRSANPIKFVKPSEKPRNKNAAPKVDDEKDFPSLG